MSKILAEHESFVGQISKLPPKITLRREEGGRERATTQPFLSSVGVRPAAPPDLSVASRGRFQDRAQYVLFGQTLHALAHTER